MNVNAVWNSYMRHSGGIVPPNALTLTIYSRRNHELHPLTIKEAKYLIDSYNENENGNVTHKSDKTFKKQRNTLNTREYKSDWDENKSRRKKKNKKNNNSLPIPLKPKFSKSQSHGNHFIQSRSIHSNSKKNKQKNYKHNNKSLPIPSKHKHKQQNRHSKKNDLPTNYRSRSKSHPRTKSVLSLKRSKSVSTKHNKKNRASRVSLHTQVTQHKHKKTNKKKQKKDKIRSKSISIHRRNPEQNKNNKSNKKNENIENNYKKQKQIKFRQKKKEKIRANSVCIYDESMHAKQKQKQKQITYRKKKKDKIRGKSVCIYDDEKDDIRDNLIDSDIITDAIQLNDIVLLTQHREGVVKYIGNVHFAKGVWFGIELINGTVGLHDGKIDKKRYFKTAACRGVFVEGNAIRRKIRNRDYNSSPQLRRRASLEQIQKIKFKDKGHSNNVTVETFEMFENNFNKKKKNKRKKLKFRYRQKAKNNSVPFNLVIGTPVHISNAELDIDFV